MIEDIKARIRSEFPDSEVSVMVEGNRALIEVTADAFAGLSRVQRHQAVYRCIQGLIADGSLHAVSIRTRTPADLAGGEGADG